MTTAGLLASIEPQSPSQPEPWKLPTARSPPCEPTPSETTQSSPSSNGVSWVDANHGPWADGVGGGILPESLTPHHHHHPAESC